MEIAGLAPVPMGLHRCDLDWLMLQRVETVLVAEQQLQWCEDGGETDCHAQHDPALLDMLAGDEVTRAHGQHHKAGSEVGRVEHMREAIGEAWVEDHGEPIGRISNPAAHFIAARGLHPAVGRQNPESGDCGAESYNRG